MKEKQFAKKKDILVVGIILLVALVAWLIFTSVSQTYKGPYAEISFDGDIIQKVYLSEGNRTIDIPQAPEVKLELKDGSIGFVHSDCADQVCVHTGFLSEIGQFAACLPNSVLVFIEGEKTPNNNANDTTAK